jgi:hypothetical protein
MSPRLRRTIAVYPPIPKIPRIPYRDSGTLILQRADYVLYPAKVRHDQCEARNQGPYLDVRLLRCQRLRGV